jgi:bifunctional DNA-binding transcriptional regulator/antitoxin component of YhaV-PrlF toxin-antitoxin module
MYHAKLFRNGNAVVLAIPTELRQLLNWEPGDPIEIHTLTPYHKPLDNVVLLFKQPTPQPEKPPHAKKPTHKTP